MVTGLAKHPSRPRWVLGLFITLFFALALGGAMWMAHHKTQMALAQIPKLTWAFPLPKVFKRMASTPEVLGFSAQEGYQVTLPPPPSSQTQGAQTQTAPAVSNGPITRTILAYLHPLRGSDQANEIKDIFSAYVGQAHEGSPYPATLGEYEALELSLIRPDGSFVIMRSVVLGRAIFSLIYAGSTRIEEWDTALFDQTIAPTFKFTIKP
jgi:hypothetical protein